MFKPGDLVQWKGAGVPTKTMRVVDVWSSGEPKQLLVVDPDEWSAGAHCSIALMLDCVMVAEGEPPARAKQERPKSELRESFTVGRDR